MRRVAGGLAATTVLTALVVTMAVSGAGAKPAPAERATAAATPKRCKGKLIFSRAIKSKKGVRIGELDVYWREKKKITCAVTKHGGPSWGKTRWTIAWLQKCPTSDRSRPCTGDVLEDQAPHAYQAGPLALRTGARCIWAAGVIHWGKKDRAYSARTSPSGSGRFCGR